MPVLCIANERMHPKVRSLGNLCLDFRLARPTKTTIAKALHKIAQKEELTCSVSEIETLCEQSGNDIRSLLNALQFSAKTHGKDALLRNDIFSATGKVFGHGTLQEKSEMVFLDSSMIPLMVQEGYIQAANKSNQDSSKALDRCWRAAESLSQWTLLDKTIHSKQAWGLLPAAVTAVVGAAVHAAGPAPFQIFPSWLGKYSKTQKHKRTFKEMQTALGCETGLLDSRDAVCARLYDPALSPKEVVDRLCEYNLTRDALQHLAEVSFPGQEPVMDSKKKSALTREWNKRMGSKVAEVTTVPDEDYVSDEEEAEEYNSTLQSIFL